MEIIWNTPHRRFNPLTEEWILVSPQRTKRPWLGQQEPVKESLRNRYQPDCYLCPGNLRAGGQRNPDYKKTFVFTNDFPALIQTPVTPKGKSPPPFFRSESVTGECRVICFSPRHDLTLAEMNPKEIAIVIKVLAEQTEELGKKYRWVQVFENKGEIMGCSNPHPHGQIWASNFLPEKPDKEDRSQKKYYHQHQSPLLLDYAQEELVCQQRVVAANRDWLVVVPFWAVWPFETLVIPRIPVRRLPGLTAEQRFSLAGILKQLLVKYDNLFQTSFPYSMGWHGAPFGQGDYSHWQLHAHFYPPLLRSATIKKFMVGYEMLAEPQRDITPEQAAEKLKEQPESHYHNL
ncbi:MAG: UDP-glucose--hexose-1-phosphate uridylyltransferase [Candidatus Omnitrophica bacterium]|nr:UDP-glucose--hexose-1-phosphate uridylyltransferase [Candidatus Omnitrophota bacterium]